MKKEIFPIEFWISNTEHRSGSFGK